MTLDNGSASSIEAFEIYNEKGDAPVVFVCEHASNFVPEKFDSLGLNDELLDYHIAWDPGALRVAKSLSKLMNAPLIAAKVSRLVYDCNRPPEAIDSIPVKSEVHKIPGNTDISEQDRNWRIQSIYEPFHDAVENVIRSKKQKGQTPHFVTIHSFVPVYKGQQRKVEIGILHDKDSRLADLVLSQSEADLDYVIRRNEPYSASDGVTHSLQKHALANDLPNVMIEIRNDLLRDDEGVTRFASDLAKILEQGLTKIKQNEEGVSS